MEELRNRFEEMGFTEPKTVLATGNVLIRGEESRPELKKRIERELTECMGTEMSVILRTEEELAQLLREAEEIDIPEEHHHYILFTDDAIYPELLKEYRRSESPGAGGLFPTSDEDMHWVVPKGRTTEGFGKQVLGSMKYKKLLTSRNISTVKKLSDALRSRGE